MGYYCTVPQCTSLAGKTKNVKFHRFPRDPMMADKWNKILKRGKPYTQYSKVCSLHFTQSDYNITTMGKTKGQWKTLSKDAIPSQNLPRLNPDGTLMVIRKSRTIKYAKDVPIKREDNSSEGSSKSARDKWPHTAMHGLPNSPAQSSSAQQDPLMYRHQQITSIIQQNQTQDTEEDIKPLKQDAVMQTDPLPNDEDEPNALSDQSSNSYHSENLDYQPGYPKEGYERSQSYTHPKDFTKTTEGYTQVKKTVEYDKNLNFKTTLQNNYAEKKEDYDKSLDNFKNQDIYGYNRNFNHDKNNYERQGYVPYDNYPNSVDLLRNQQHNIQMLSNQNMGGSQGFFTENHIKQEVEIDFKNEEDNKYVYDRNKEIEQNQLYDEHRRMLQERDVLNQMQVKTEPDVMSHENGIPPGQPYYQDNIHDNITGAYYDQFARQPGPELLIAKQNALAAHTQLWQNTMKRPFFYSETPNYAGSQLIHRYEDLTRILQ